MTRHSNTKPLVSKQSESFDFKECFECAKKPGSPTLCQQCLWVRKNIPPLIEVDKEIEKALTKVKQPETKRHLKNCFANFGGDHTSSCPVSETWEDRFDKEFPDSRGIFEGGDNYNLRRNAIKSFIQQELNNQKKELLEQTMIIAFDVDDTLILPPEATGLDRDTPNYETIAIYRWFQSQGNTMIIWSGGGVDYAKMWADKLGLKPDYIAPKQKTDAVDIAFDDCNVDLGKVNVKVKRLNNSVTRTVPGERFLNV